MSPRAPSTSHQRPSPHTELAAMNFIQSVKDAFHADYPMSDIKYQHFLSVLQDYKDQRIDIKQLTKKCSTLLKGHPELIPAFNSFLPLGWTVILPSSPESSASTSFLQARRVNARDKSLQSMQLEAGEALERSLRFMERVKDRLADDEETERRYSALLATLKLPLLTPQNTLQLCCQVRAILQDHPDLCEEFNQFIPAHEATENVSTPIANKAVDPPPWNWRHRHASPVDMDSDTSSEASSLISSTPSTILGSPTPTIRSASTPPSSRHASPSSTKHRRLASNSSELMSLTLDAIVRDQGAKPTPKEGIRQPFFPSSLPFYPTLSVTAPHPPSTSQLSQSNKQVVSPIHEFPNPSELEVQFHSTPNVDLRHNGIFEDSAVHQYAPVIYPFNVAAGRKSTLEVRNWTWEASDPNPYPSVSHRSLKRALDPPSSPSIDEPRKKKQFLRLSGGGSAQGMFGAVGDGRLLSTYSVVEAL